MLNYYKKLYKCGDSNMNLMNIEYDKDADAAYITIVDLIKDGEAKKNIEVNDNVIMDFDEK